MGRSQAQSKVEYNTKKKEIKLLVHLFPHRLSPHHHLTLHQKRKEKGKDIGIHVMGMKKVENFCVWVKT